MIDVKTGNIKISDSFELAPKSNFSMLEGQDLGQSHILRDMGNGYKWPDIKNIHVDDEYFNISLCFKEELLIELDLIVSNEKFRLSSDWSSWSDEKEKLKLKSCQDWLDKELGGKTNFHWGNVRSSYDLKSGASSIGIRYS